MSSTTRLRNFIDGACRDSDSEETTDVVDPCTGETYLVAPASGPADVDTAMRAAASAYESWRSTTPAQRQLALLKLADGLERREADFVAAECRNTGSLAHEFSVAIDQLRFFAGAARILEGQGATEYAKGHTSYTRREPLGVCAQLAPWNYPFMMAMLKSAPALAAGNTVVLKPAASTPVSSLLFAEVAAEFLPPGVLNVVCGGDETGQLMVRHPIPRMVSLTGSVATGMDVATVAAADLKRAHLELGGKTPVVVFADADLDLVTETIIGAGFGNAGQDCTAATRVLVAREIYDDLAKYFTTAAEACRPAPPSDPEASYGPLNNADQLRRVARFLGRLPSHASLLTGGHQVGDRGYFFAPTIIKDVRQDDEVSQQEIFAPVITMQPFDSEDEAIRCANGVNQGLASSVWTTDHGRAMRLSQRLEFGCVWVNTHMLFPSEMPHGGFKHSGYGKDLSLSGLHDYTRVKHVMHRLEMDD